MPTTPTTTVRIDSDLKKDANDVFEKIGIGMSAAINTFLKAVVRQGRLPFDINPGDKGSGSKGGNLTLNKAFINKRDEFYTMYEDVAKEMAKHQMSLNGKSILCNCDDPFESAFFRYFAINFNRLGITRLTCTCFADSSLTGSEYPFEGSSNAYKAVVTQVPEEGLLNPDGSFDIESLFDKPGNTLESLAGNGDFRSSECMELLKESDIVVTNPPFSLFREYMAVIFKHAKNFIILGNMNAVTCKEIFPLFRDNKVWYGESIKSGDRKFFVPDSYPLSATGCGIDENGRRYIRVKGVRWFTNLDFPGRHKFLQLKENYNPFSYPRYENYDAIEVSKTSRIPVDYKGPMGVPITFLDKFNPDQFEILMLANGNARTNESPEILSSLKYMPHQEDRGGVGIINGKRIYARIIIRHREN